MDPHDVLSPPGVAKSSTAADHPAAGTAAHEELQALIDGLAEVVWDADEARTLVWNAGFPRGSTPNFTTPQVFWATVVEGAANGRLPGGVRPLVDAAVRRFPDYELFKRHQVGVASSSSAPADDDAPSRSKVRPTLARSGHAWRNYMIVLFLVASLPAGILYGYWTSVRWDWRLLFLDAGKHVFHIILLPVAGSILISAFPWRQLVGSLDAPSARVRRFGRLGVALVLFLEALAPAFGLPHIIDDTLDGGKLPYPTDFKETDCDDANPISKARLLEIGTTALSSNDGCINLSLLLSGHPASKDGDSSREPIGPRAALSWLNNALRNAHIKNQHRCSDGERFHREAVSFYEAAVKDVVNSCGGSYWRVTSTSALVGGYLSMLGFAVALLALAQVMIALMLYSGKFVGDLISRTEWRLLATHTLIACFMLGIWVPCRFISSQHLNYGHLQSDIGMGFLLIVCVALVSLAILVEMRASKWQKKVAALALPFTEAAIAICVVSIDRFASWVRKAEVYVLAPSILVSLVVLGYLCVWSAQELRSHVPRRASGAEED